MPSDFGVIYSCQCSSFLNTLVSISFFRESAVFYNETRETLEDQQEIAKLVTNAVVKQWYQYADMTKWWSNVWVSEGMSMLYQYEILDKIKPNWRLLEQFLIQELATTFDYDAETGITLLSNNTKSLSKFYKFKAFALVRMFSHLLLPGE